jgi:hypothetical protein
VEEEEETVATPRSVAFKVWSALREAPSRVRAKLLHVSAPCDKSSWQCFQDLKWVGLTCIGLLPYGVGTIWWLFMFTLHDKRDGKYVCLVCGFDSRCISRVQQCRSR